MCFRQFSQKISSASSTHSRWAKLLLVAAHRKQHGLCNTAKLISRSGLSCATDSSKYQTCLTIATSTMFQIGLCGSTAYGSLYSITIPGNFTYSDHLGSTWVSAAHNVTLRAPLVQLNWKASDTLPTLSATKDQNMKIVLSSPSSLAPSSYASSAAVVQSEALSSGAKIAIGVAVLVRMLTGRVGNSTRLEFSTRPRIALNDELPDFILILAGFRPKKNKKY